MLSEQQKKLAALELQTFLLKDWGAQLRHQRAELALPNSGSGRMVGGIELNFRDQRETNEFSLPTARLETLVQVTALRPCMPCSKSAWGD